MTWMVKNVSVRVPLAGPTRPKTLVQAGMPVRLALAQPATVRGAAPLTPTSPTST